MASVHKYKMVKRKSVNKQAEVAEDMGAGYASMDEDDAIDIKEHVDIALDEEAEKRIKQKIKGLKVCDGARGSVL
jgi:hypothetical protein